MPINMKHSKEEVVVTYWAAKRKAWTAFAREGGKTLEEATITSKNVRVVANMRTIRWLFIAWSPKDFDNCGNPLLLDTEMPDGRIAFEFEWNTEEPKK